MNHSHDHEVFMRRCVTLAEESLREGDLPFGSVLVRDGEIVAEAKNTAITLRDITGHAEVNVMRDVFRAFPNFDFSRCTLYTNFEPCAMCAFLIRDIGVGSVVFGAASPHVGGYSRWDILDHTLLRPEFTTNHVATPPVVVEGVLKEEIDRTFDDLKWLMHHADSPL